MSVATERLPELKSFTRGELRERFLAEGLPGYRADQVAAWLYTGGVDDPERMTDLPRDLREWLDHSWILRSLELESVRSSWDGTRKATLRARDGAVVEAVLIPEDGRTTLCVSTQVGCPLACSFCATGALGFTRNLSTAEILDQVCRMREQLAEGERLTNIVFMGMGEPLLNTAAVLRAIDVLTDQKAMGMAPRRITVSTAGVVPQIGRLLRETSVHLAVSLHATTDALRDELVPLNRRFPLRTLLATLRDDPNVTRRRPVFFEYTLIGGVNDALDDARRLVGLLRGMPCKVNVIPMNPHGDSPYRAPDPATTDRFTAWLHEAGLRVTLRRSRGTDIEAACGQLAAREARIPQP